VCGRSRRLRRGSPSAVGSCTGLHVHRARAFVRSCVRGRAMMAGPFGAAPCTADHFRRSFAWRAPIEPCRGRGVRRVTAWPDRGRRSPIHGRPSAMPSAPRLSNRRTWPMFLEMRLRETLSASPPEHLITKIGIRLCDRFLACRHYRAVRAHRERFGAFHGPSARTYGFDADCNDRGGRSCARIARWERAVRESRERDAVE
jgi:hypothetical protein